MRWASDDMREQRISAVDCGIERKTTVKENTSAALLGRKKKEAERWDYAALRLRRVRSDSKVAILIKLLASTAAPTHNSKRYALRRDSASCRDRGTARRSLRCPLESARPALLSLFTTSSWLRTNIRSQSRARVESGRSPREIQRG